MATLKPPVALYAQSDHAKAQPVLHTLGGIAGIAVPSSSLSQGLQLVPSVLASISAASTIILLVSNSSRNSALFQDIAFYAQQNSIRLIVIDLDNVSHGAVGGNLGHFSNSVVPASDPDLEKILEGEDRWTLPGGAPYPKRNIKRQKKC